jgi:hypothetical protein
MAELAMKMPLIDRCLIKIWFAQLMYYFCWIPGYVIYIGRLGPNSRGSPGFDPGHDSDSEDGLLVASMS